MSPAWALECLPSRFCRRDADDGVRAPIASTTSRLFTEPGVAPGAYIGSGARATKGYRTPLSMFSSSNRKLDSMFRPPTDILLDRPFAEAIAAAKDMGRLLIVHLLAEGDFVSATWNRDIWSNDDVREFVKDTFVLYQQFMCEWFRSGGSSSGLERVMVWGRSDRGRCHSC